MKKNWLLATLLATVAIALGTATTALASPPPHITPDHPGGVAAPHSPDGIPSNIEGPSMPSWTSAIRFAKSIPAQKFPAPTTSDADHGKAPIPSSSFRARPRMPSSHGRTMDPASKPPDSAPIRSITIPRRIRSWKLLRPAATSTPPQRLWPTSSTRCSRQPGPRKSTSSAIHKVAAHYRAPT